MKHDDADDQKQIESAWLSALSALGAALLVAVAIIIDILAR